MKRWIIPHYFLYLSRHYGINLLALLAGLSTAFATIDYFQHAQQLASSNYKILYIFYMWEEALALLFPLAIVFAVIMTKVMLIKQSNMVALHSFGYTTRKLFAPFGVVAIGVYILFLGLHTTEFSYAKDKARALLDRSTGAYEVSDLFFIYDGDFVYAKELDPIRKEIHDLTLFKLEGNRLLYTFRAKEARFNGKEWDASDIIIKELHDDEQGAKSYKTYFIEQMKTLVGYRPQVIESIYEGKTLNILDTFSAWRLLEEQGLPTEKLRSALYYKALFPLFAIAMALILFFKIPFHPRYMNMAWVVAIAVGSTFVVWGAFFALNQIGQNGVLVPELAMIVPLSLLVIAALWVYIRHHEQV
jgi:lipopolysaccharide export system permease protein